MNMNRQFHPTAAQLNTIVKKLPKPRITPVLNDSGNYYCIGTGMCIQGDSIRQAYIRWVAMLWRRIVLGAVNSRRLKLS